MSNIKQINSLDVNLKYFHSIFIGSKEKINSAYLINRKIKSRYLPFWHFFSSFWKDNFCHICWQCKEEGMPVFYKPAVCVGLPCLVQKKIKIKIDLTSKGSLIPSQNVTNLQ